MKQALDALIRQMYYAGGETGCDHQKGICFCQENDAIAAIRLELAKTY